MVSAKKKRYLIIGGVAGGASVAARLRRLDEQAEITMLERGRDVSFSNCALPYFLGDEIESSETLMLVDPQTFWDRYRIRALTRTEALRINRESRTVLARSLESSTETEMPYDILFLSPGASAIMPDSIPGIRLPQVFSVRNVEDVEKINRFLKPGRSGRSRSSAGASLAWRSWKTWSRPDTPSA